MSMSAVHVAMAERGEHWLATSEALIHESLGSRNVGRPVHSGAISQACLANPAATQRTNSVIVL